MRSTALATKRALAAALWMFVGAVGILAVFSLLFMPLISAPGVVVALGGGWLAHRLDRGAGADWGIPLGMGSLFVGFAIAHGETGYLYPAGFFALVLLIALREHFGARRAIRR